MSFPLRFILVILWSIGLYLSNSFWLVRLQPSVYETKAFLN